VFGNKPPVIYITLYLSRRHNYRTQRKCNFAYINITIRTDYTKLYNTV